MLRPCSDLPHIPQSVPYDVPEVLRDLLVFAAQTLVMGGRLVYWLPTTDQCVPSPPSTSAG